MNKKVITKVQKNVQTKTKRWEKSYKKSSQKKFDNPVRK